MSERDWRIFREVGVILEGLGHEGKQGSNVDRLLYIFICSLSILNAIIDLVMFPRLSLFKVWSYQSEPSSL